MIYVLLGIEIDYFADEVIVEKEVTRYDYYSGKPILKNERTKYRKIKLDVKNLGIKKDDVIEWDSIFKKVEEADDRIYILYDKLCIETKITTDDKLISPERLILLYNKLKTHWEEIFPELPFNIYLSLNA